MEILEHLQAIKKILDQYDLGADGKHINQCLAQIASFALEAEFPPLRGSRASASSSKIGPSRRMNSPECEIAPIKNGWIDLIPVERQDHIDLSALDCIEKIILDTQLENPFTGSSNLSAMAIELGLDYDYASDLDSFIEHLLKQICGITRDEMHLAKTRLYKSRHFSAWKERTQEHLVAGREIRADLLP